MPENGRNARVCRRADDELMEFNNGLIAGKGREEAQERYPYIPDLPVHAAVYEQESKLEFRYRAEYILSKILSENGSDSTIAVVSHGGTINQLCRAFLRIAGRCSDILVHRRHRHPRMDDLRRNAQNHPLQQSGSSGINEKGR